MSLWDTDNECLSCTYKIYSYGPGENLLFKT